LVGFRKPVLMTQVILDLSTAGDRLLGTFSQCLQAKSEVELLFLLECAVSSVRFVNVELSKYAFA
jgi:hypothetical protein